MILASLIEKGGLSQIANLTRGRQLPGGVAEVAAVAIADYGTDKTDNSTQTTIESNASSLERMPNIPDVLSRSFERADEVATATPATVATLQEPQTTEGIIGIHASATKAAEAWRRLFGYSRPVEEIERHLADLQKWQSKPIRFRAGKFKFTE